MSRLNPCYSYISGFKEPLSNFLELNTWSSPFAITESCYISLLKFGPLSLSILYTKVWSTWASEDTMNDFGVTWLWLYVIYLHSHLHHTSQTCTHCRIHETLGDVWSTGCSCLSPDRLSARCNVLPWNNSWSWLPSWFMSCMLAAPLLTNFCLSASACHWLNCLLLSAMNFHVCWGVCVCVCLTGLLLFMEFSSRQGVLLRKSRSRGEVWKWFTLHQRFPNLS